MQSHAERINLEVHLHPESYANCIKPFAQTRRVIGSDTDETHTMYGFFGMRLTLLRNETHNGFGMRLTVRSRINHAQ